MTEKAKRRPPGSRTADRVLAEIAAERAARPQCRAKLDLIDKKLDGADTFEMLFEDEKDGDRFGPRGLRIKGEDF